MIDLLKAGISDRRHDAIGVAHCGSARIAGIDENGLAGWRDIKLGVTSLGIDDIDVERLRCSNLCCDNEGREREDHHEQYGCAHWMSP